MTKFHVGQIVILKFVDKDILAKIHGIDKFDLSDPFYIEREDAIGRCTWASALRVKAFDGMSNRDANAIGFSSRCPRESAFLIDGGAQEIEI